MFGVDPCSIYWNLCSECSVNGSNALDELLTNKGINHIFRITEGRHEWTVWRYHLNEFAPLLFK